MAVINPGVDGVAPEEYIAAIPMWTKKKNSLSDIREFLKALNVREKNIVHVAGTNGKGSVCAYLTSILTAAGYSVGTFVSPHLCDMKERFIINGDPVGEADFTETFNRVLSVVKDKREEGFFHPSYFEFLFLMAMTLFTEKNVDFTILETGLGGRLDATNSIKEALACIITSISLDHTQYLGDTIEKIAAEKAGIIKPGVPVIYDADDAAAAQVIAKTAKEKDAPAFPVSTEKAELPDGLEFSAPYQKTNAALALRAIRVLAVPDVTEDSIFRGLSDLNWQGRMEEISPGIWLDGAHNPGGISAFIEAVKEQESKDGPFGIHLLFASANDKDYPAMIRLLCRELSPEEVTVTAFEGERAADPHELSELFRAEGAVKVKAFDDPRSALGSALEDVKDPDCEDDRLYITGSLYLIGALRPHLL